MPTHEVKDIIRKFSGLFVSPDLWISVTELLDQLAGGSPEVNSLENNVARRWCVDDNLERAPYVSPSGPGDEAAFFFFKIRRISLGRTGFMLNGLSISS